MAINIPTSVAGNLTSAPEPGTTAGGTRYVSFGIAENRDRFNQETNQYEKDTTYFHRATIWGKAAEHFLASGISTGDRVIASGDLQLVSWTDDAGKHRQSTELRVSSIGRDVTMPPRQEATIAANVEAAIDADQQAGMQSPQAVAEPQQEMTDNPQVQAAQHSWNQQAYNQQPAGFQANSPHMGM